MGDSVRTRLTLWYVAVVGVVLVGFSLGVYALLFRVLHSRVDESLLGILDTAITSLSNDAAEGQSPEDGARSTVAELSHRWQRLAVYDPDGRLLARAPGAPKELRLPSAVPQPPGGPILYSIREDDDDDDHRLAVIRTRLPGGTAYLIAASQPLEPLNDELESVREVLTTAVPLAMAVAAIGGWFLARKALKPVVAMADEARRMGFADVGGALPVANPRDELGKLALAFNDLLGRIATAFGQQRQFMADASHELRTPLATIQTAASVGLQKATRPEHEYREALGIVIGQSRRLRRLVDEMLTLARADAGHLPLRHEKLDLGEVLHDAARTASLLGGPRRVRIEVQERDEEVPYEGDAELLVRMLQNLLDNAVRYTADGGVVELGLSVDPASLRISVRDAGPGIPAEAQPRVFDRFFRVDEARSRGGAGLGLAIARWVAEAHKGKLELVRSGPRDTLFEVTLPRRSAVHPGFM
jgi:two-component system, OmpR family, sensor kinase